MIAIILMLRVVRNALSHIINLAGQSIQKQVKDFHCLYFGYCMGSETKIIC